MLAQSCKFWVYCCFIGLTRSPRGLHPSMCASDFWTCPQTPPCLTQFAQKGCQSTGLELRTLLIYSKFVVVPRKFSGGGVQNTLTPPFPPPLREDPHKQLSTRGFRVCFLLGLTRDVQKLCFLQPPGCGTSVC